MWPFRNVLWWVEWIPKGRIILVSMGDGLLRSVYGGNGEFVENNWYFGKRFGCRGVFRPGCKGLKWRGTRGIGIIGGRNVCGALVDCNWRLDQIIGCLLNPLFLASFVVVCFGPLVFVWRDVFFSIKTQRSWSVSRLLPRIYKPYRGWLELLRQLTMMMHRPLLCSGTPKKHTMFPPIF